MRADPVSFLILAGIALLVLVIVAAALNLCGISPLP